MNKRVGGNHYKMRISRNSKQDPPPLPLELQTKRGSFWTSKHKWDSKTSLGIRECENARICGKRGCAPDQLSNRNKKKPIFELAQHLLLSRYSEQSDNPTDQQDTCAFKKKVTPSTPRDTQTGYCIWLEEGIECCIKRR